MYAVIAFLVFSLPSPRRWSNINHTPVYTPAGRDLRDRGGRGRGRRRKHHVLRHPRFSNNSSETHCINSEGKAPYAGVVCACFRAYGKFCRGDACTRVRGRDRTDGAVGGGRVCIAARTLKQHRYSALGRPAGTRVVKDRGVRRDRRDEADIGRRLPEGSVAAVHISFLIARATLRENLSRQLRARTRARPATFILPFPIHNVVYYRATSDASLHRRLVDGATNCP